ncbi:MAG: endonuclease/exonuclease/phosphatase family protein [Candidatus Kapabacteria bacterium]|jgi:predicted extracellular nuclease|nr:endonuclease/exonuclease/phosphatase family protein [Candidatus Kapabacteria bacterium]
MKLSLATFNVQNLTRAGKPIYTEKRPLYTAQEFDKKRRWIQTQLEKMSADIIGFQEVIEEEALRECVRGTPQEHWHIVAASPNGKTPVNALLSRFPVIRTDIVRDIPFDFEFFDENALAALNPALNKPSEPIILPVKQFSRAVLKVELAITRTFSIVVCVLHLKSKRPTLPDGLDRDEASPLDIAQGSIRSLIRRGIEAAGVRAIVSAHLEERPATPLVVMGDLNDSDTAVTNQAMLGEPPFHRLSPEEKNRRWKYVLQNSRDVQARRSMENYYYTYIHNGHYESLDNIFVSNHFADRNAERLGRIIDVRLFNDHIFDQTLSHDRKPLHVSDHGQVVTNLDVFEDKI